MSKKDKIKLLITGILGLIFLVTVINTVNYFRQRRKSRQPARRDISAGTDIGPEELFSETGLYFLTEKISKNLKLSRDPFSKARPQVKDLSDKEVTLLGIIWDQESPRAIIGSRIVEIGDKINNKTVIDIKKDYIVILDGVDQYKLRLEF